MVIPAPERVSCLSNSLISLHVSWSCVYDCLAFLLPLSRFLTIVMSAVPIFGGSHMSLSTSKHFGVPEKVLEHWHTVIHAVNKLLVSSLACTLPILDRQLKIPQRPLRHSWGIRNLQGHILSMGFHLPAAVLF